MANEMVEWVERKIGPAATPLADADAVKNFIEDNDVAIVGYFKDQDSSAAKDYLKAVKDYEEYPCGITSDAAAAEANNIKEGEVVLFKNFDDRRAVYEGAISKDSLLEFIQRYAVPLVVRFNHDSAQKIFRGLVKSHLLVFISEKSDDYPKAVKAMTKLGEEFRNKVMMVTVDTEEDDHRRIIEFLGLKGETFPLMRIIQMKDDIDKYKPVDAYDVTNEEDLRNFVQNYLDGKVPQHYLTEDLPEDWDAKPVKILTGKNFDKVVFDKTKTVLVEFYAPWCGHCKQLAPVWDKLGEAFKEEGKDDVIVAKIDATINELPHSRVRSFPTISLYVKGEKQSDYNGERKCFSFVFGWHDFTDFLFAGTFEGIKKFLETNGEYGKAAPDHDEL